MNVAGRAQKLRGKVKALDGVLEVDINYVLNTVSIKYDSDKVKLPKTRTMMNTR